MYFSLEDVPSVLCTGDVKMNKTQLRASENSSCAAPELSTSRRKCGVLWGGHAREQTVLCLGHRDGNRDGT